MAGKIVVSTLNNDTGVLATQNGMTGIAKAWVQFTTSGTTPTINSSFNISSITYVANGQFTVTFTTAMPDAKYCPSINASIDSQTGTTWLYGVMYLTPGAPYYQAPTANSFYAGFVSDAGANKNPLYASIIVHSA